MLSTEVLAAKRTAISRKIASLPMRLIVDSEDLCGCGLHFGCGKDHMGTAILHKMPEVTVVMEYDPNFADYPEMLESKYDFVISNYVLNVLPPKERKCAIKQLLNCMKKEGVAYITVRAEGQPIIKGKSTYDGYRTSIGTFQKIFTIVDLKRELRKHFKNIQLIHGGSSRKFIMVKVSN